MRNLLLTLSEKDKAAGDVAWIVAKNFDELPEDVRNNLLLEFSKKGKLTKIVKEIIKDYFYILPENTTLRIH